MLPVSIRGVYLPNGPFRGSTAIARRWLTRGQLRARCVRVFPDVYVRRGVDLDLVTRSNAALVLVRMRGVLAGWSAAALHDAGCIPFDAPAELVVQRFLRAPPGLVVRYHRLGHDEVTEVDERPLTTPLRTAYDLARTASTVTEAVVVVDALARRGCFSPHELLTLAARHPGARGVGTLRRAVALADPLAESPMESRTRMVMVLGGLPKPALQVRVRHPSGLTDRLDMAYEQLKLGIEYDGDQHRERRAFAADLRRHNRLLSAGWTVLRVTASDVLLRPDRLVAEVGSAIAHREREFNTTVATPRRARPWC